MIPLQPHFDHRTATSGDLKHDIVRYYDECYWDYRTSWMDADNLAIHYGYWDSQTRSHSQSLLNMNRELANTAQIEPGQRVLDAGCGVGGSSIWLAAQRGAEVTGITLSRRQCERARAQAERRGLSGQVRFQVADFCKMPYADHSFDVVWGIESICHALDKRAVLAEAFRVLRPGGRLVCSDGYALKSSYTEAEWEVVTTCLNGWAIPNLAGRDAFHEQLEASGFGCVRFRDITSHILPSSRRLYRTALWTRPMQTFMAKLRLRSAVQSGNFYTALHQYRIFRDGLACYGIFLAGKNEKN